MTNMKFSVFYVNQIDIAICRFISIDIYRSIHIFWILIRKGISPQFPFHKESQETITIEF